MKAMTCKQLGGACDLDFRAETFEQMVELSKQHGMQMFQQNDEAHLAAMHKIQQLMQEPGAMEKWKEGRKQAFEALAED